MTVDELAKSVCDEAALELQRATDAIRHCLNLLLRTSPKPPTSLSSAAARVTASSPAIRGSAIGGATP